MPVLLAARLGVSPQLADPVAPLNERTWRVLDSFFHGQPARKRLQYGDSPDSLQWPAALDRAFYRPESLQVVPRFHGTRSCLQGPMPQGTVALATHDTTAGERHAGGRLLRVAGPGARHGDSLHRRCTQRPLRPVCRRRTQFSRRPVANPGHGPFADQPGGAGPRPDAAGGRPARLPAALDRRRGDLAVPRAVALELAHPLKAAARSRMTALRLKSKAEKSAGMLEAERETAGACVPSVHSSSLPASSAFTEAFTIA